jgi:intracellular sulfur oxidation DsrE/DsrF family protein
MRRRGLFGGLLAAAGLGALGPTLAQAPAKPPKLKVVYHLSDLEKVDFVLGNIRHHYEGAGGADKVTIALVVHGPALRAFRADASAAPLERLAHLRGNGLAPYACANSLQGMNATLADFAPGFSLAEQGGVVLLAQLQALGYVYLRP